DSFGDGQRRQRHECGGGDSSWPDAGAAKRHPVSWSSTCGGWPSRPPTSRSAKPPRTRPAWREQNVNKYGAQAMQHWKTHAPERYMLIENPTRFFTELGLEAQGQITVLARQIETNRPLLLAKTPSSRETYIKDVAHRMTALR